MGSKTRQIDKNPIDFLTKRIYNKTMLKRFISPKILDYLQSQAKNALLVTGARQVGKTFLIHELLKQEKCDYVEINFLENRKAKELFSNYKSTKDLLDRISAVSNHSLIKGKTIIFFDEVQEVKEIVTAIKFLVEEGSYKYILSGSMLGVELSNIASQPVGYIDEIKMFPLDFSEFAIALGASSTTLEKLRSNFNNKEKVDDIINDQMLSLFKLYLIIGGMPEAINVYISTNDLNEVFNVQKNIMLRYREDIVKYVDKEKIYIKAIFDNIPSELNKQNKRFIYSNINKNFRFDRSENNFIWLTDAGVANACFVVDELRVPLKLSKASNLFKLYQSDVGLLVSTCDKTLQMNILNDDKNVNFGSIYENAVAQILKAHGYDLYFYNNKKRGEIDFVIEEKGKVYPIEIKSGKYYIRHRALSNVVNDKLNGITEGFVYGNCNIYKENGIQYYPIYMIDFLNKIDDSKNIYKINIDSLKK